MTNSCSPSSGAASGLGVGLPPRPAHRPPACVPARPTWEYSWCCEPWLGAPRPRPRARDVEEGITVTTSKRQSPKTPHTSHIFWIFSKLSVRKMLQTYLIYWGLVTGCRDKPLLWQPGITSHNALIVACYLISCRPRVTTHTKLSGNVTTPLVRTNLSIKIRIHKD